MTGFRNGTVRHTSLEWSKEGQEMSSASNIKERGDVCCFGDLVVNGSINQI